MKPADQLTFVAVVNALYAVWMFATRNYVAAFINSATFFGMLPSIAFIAEGDKEAKP